MKTFEITANENGVCKKQTIQAENRDEALKTAWSLGFEDVYVTEVVE